MGEETKSLIELRAYSRHSDVYRWLRENFHRVSHDVVVLRRTWEALAADVAGTGVKGVRGAAPYAASVRRIWHRVVQDVKLDEQRAADREREKEAQKAKRDAYPSRMSRDLRPIQSLPALRSEQRSLVVSSSAGASETTPIDWKERFSPSTQEGTEEKNQRKFRWEARSYRFLSKREHHELKIEFDYDYRVKWHKANGSYDWDGG